MATLSSSGGGLPRTPLTATRSGPAVEADGVEAGRSRRGWRTPARPDLVEELGGHRADGDGAAGAGLLGDHGRTVGGDLRDREPRVTVVGELVEEASSCRRSPVDRTR